MTPVRKPPALTGLMCLLAALIALAAGEPSTAGAAGPLPGEGFLPDGRVWELVSPPDKNGGDVMRDTGRTRAAADGSAMGFASLVGFADARGFGIATDYLSQRSTEPTPGSNGWVTHGITPQQQPLTVFAVFQGMDPHYSGEFSPDLTMGFFQAWSPLTDDPNNENVPNLYLRDDLRTPGAGSYRLVSGSATPLPTPGASISTARPRIAGASADFSHVFITSRLNLADGAAGSGPKLYEWVGGEVRLAGILPDGTPAACGSGSPPVCSIPGQGGLNGRYTQPRRTVSEDGSRVVFTAPTSNHSSTEGLGTLYQRIDGAETVHVNASERTDCAGDPSCGGDSVPDSAPDPGGPQEARFEWASSDGLRIFFKTAEQLTDDDDNLAIDLYLHQADASPGERLTRLSVDENPVDPPGSTTEGVIGTSEDGDYVYFIASGQIVAGAPEVEGGYGIYLWHDGDLDYIGSHPPTLEGGQDLQSNIPTTFGIAGARYRARVTPDGRRLLFVSESGAGLLSVHGGVDYDHAGTSQRYVYDADTGELACVSCNPSGAAATADALTDVRLATGSAGTSWHVNHTFSDDGRYAFFHTAARLVPEDVNGPCTAGTDDCVDVYVHDLATGSTSLISSGRSDSGSYFLDASADGRDVFFATRERLSGWDVDRAHDVYDARVGGGFPEPLVAPAACVGSDGCQGPAVGPPATGGGGSQALSGQGNHPKVVAAGCSKHNRRLSRARRQLRRAERGGSRKQARRAVRKAQRQLRACRRSGR